MKRMRRTTGMAWHDGGDASERSGSQVGSKFRSPNEQYRSCEAPAPRLATHGWNTSAPRAKFTKANDPDAERRGHVRFVHSGRNSLAERSSVAHFKMGAGTKQLMLVSIRKFDSVVWRSAWKMSMLYSWPTVMPSSAAFASKSIVPFRA